jgi:hypothetical protein
MAVFLIINALNIRDTNMEAEKYLRLFINLLYLEFITWAKESGL